MKFLVDSNVFFAIADAKDSTHAKAKEMLVELKKYKPYVVYVPAGVFEETISLVSRRIHKEAAIGIAEEILHDEDTVIIHTSSPQIQRAFEIFISVISKNFSFCDALTLAAAEEEGVDVIVSFDADLKKIKGPWKVWG